jgi:hypothetical protein
MPSDSEHNPAQPAQGNKIIASALVIYGTLCLLIITLPGTVVGWVQGFEGNLIQQTAMRAAETIQSLSDNVGLSVPYIRARTWFLQQVRGD